MKKLILIATLLALATPVGAQQGFVTDNFGNTKPLELARLGPVMVGSGSGVACASKTMGTQSSGGSSTQSIDVGQVATIGVTAPTFSAPCTGALKTAHVTNVDTRTDNRIKICIYNDADVVGTPDSSDTKVACSGVITGTATNPEELTASFASGTVTSGAKYRIVIANDDSSGGAFSIKYLGTTSDFETTTKDDCTTFYDTPPDNLGCTWGSNANRRLEVWVDVE